MTRHQCSYWLTAVFAGNPVAEENLKPGTKSPKDLMAALESSALSVKNGGVMTFSLENGFVCGEVESEKGTTEQDNSLVHTVAEIAKKFGRYEISFLELDEEDHANQVLTTFSRGKTSSVSHARIIDAGQAYDDETVDMIAVHLARKGFHEAADEIRRTFPYEE